MIVNEQLEEYVKLLQNHKVTEDSPVTLDLAWAMVGRLISGRNVNEGGYEILSACAVVEGYDPMLMEEAVKIVGGRL